VVVGERHPDTGIARVEPGPRIRPAARPRRARRRGSPRPGSRRR
jgi:hypothetical protein